MIEIKSIKKRKEEDTFSFSVTNLKSAGSSKVEPAAAVACCILFLIADGAILLRFMPIPPLIAANDFSLRLASFLWPIHRSNCF